MRFASAAKNTGANIINAGMAGGGSQFFEASRAAAPDYTGLANVSLDTRFDVAADKVKTDGEVLASKKTSDAQIKSDADILNSRSNAEKAVKKAGLLAAATGAGLKLFKKKKPPTEPAKVIPHETATLPLEDIEALKATLKERYNNLRPSATTASGSTTGVVPASSHGGGGGGGGTNSSPVAGSTDLSKLSEQDWKDLAFVVSGEAHPNSDDEYGVAASVLNRVASDQFPGTISDVIHAKGQYAAIKNGGARHVPELVASLSSETGRAGILKALETLNGRTDFKGQALLHNRSSRGNKDGILDPMFHDKGNFYHYAGQT